MFNTHRVEFITANKHVKNAALTNASELDSGPQWRGLLKIKIDVILR